MHSCWLSKGEMPMSAREMEPWLRRFDKIVKEQKFWDAAVEKAHELAHVKKSWIAL